VGCAGATDDRAKKTQKSMVKILKAAKVDFAILGCEEKCTGDPARRMGNEYVFDALRQENVAVMGQYEGKFKKVFTACPHCFNSLKNEYNQYDDKYAAQKVSVQHHTELLAELMKDKRIPIDAAKKIEEHVTLHDPCYVSRYNDEVDAPRDVLKGTPGVELTEMARHGKKSFCCGAGGGRMWMEEHIGKRVNVERTEEALVALNTKKKPKSTIAVGCPFCMTMLTDGTKAKDVEESIMVKDVAEILAERLVDAPAS
jgi:Fe-S oxidoreductase